MPPKKSDKKEKKPSGRKSGKEKASAVIDGLPVSSMSKEQLEGHVIRLRDELDKEREERNYFQLERDKMQAFWEVTKRQLDERKADLRNRERDLEVAEEKHLAEIKMYKQKVQFLMHEHQSKLTEAKTEHLTIMKQTQDRHNQNETDLLEEKRSIKRDLHDQEKIHQSLIHDLKLKNNEALTNMKLELQKQVAEIESRYESKMKIKRGEMDQQRKQELQELEERKNQQINTLIRNHDKAFVDIKNYYNDITVNNLALITTLKEQIESMKNKEDRLEKQVSEVLAENKRLANPLQKAQAEVGELRKQMLKYERDKVILNSTKARLKASMEEIKDLKWELEVLEQKFKQLQAERDDLHDKFVSAIQEVQQKSSLKNLLLEKKLKTLEELVERKDAQLNEVIASCNLDPAVVTVVNKKVEDILNSKESIIRNLEKELAHTRKAFEELMQLHKSQMKSQELPPNSSSNHGLKLPHVPI